MLVALIPLSWNGMGGDGILIGPQSILMEVTEEGILTGHRFYPHRIDRSETQRSSLILIEFSSSACIKQKIDYYAVK